jgi:hypothetical protein
MQTQSNNHLQLQLNLFQSEETLGKRATVRRVVSERTRDSVGQFATELDAANDKIERICNERDIYRANYLAVARELAEIQRRAPNP